MYTTTNTLTKQISDDECEAFLAALTLYYSEGLPIGDAFSQVEPGLVDRYYRRKKNYPGEIEEINREAVAVVQKEMSGEQLAMASRQMRESRSIQSSAIEATRDALATLRRIVIGEAVDVEGKTLIPYPRDQIAAAGVILSIARNGVMPERMPQKIVEMLVADKEEKAEDKPPLIPLLGVNPNFSSVTATRPDGTKFTAYVEGGIEVIEGEVDEVGE